MINQTKVGAQAQVNNQSNAKAGLLKLGYVTNLKTCKSELSEMLTDEKQVSSTELSSIVDNASIVYLNRYGYAQTRSGEAVKPKDATYLYFDTCLTNKGGASVIGWFERKGRDATFKGVNWGTKAALEAKIRADRMFHWGDLYFKSEEDGLAFLEDIAASTIPETWSFKNKPTTVNHPILKSYIENTFEVLKKEAERGAKNKLVYSQDGKHLLFNTNLLDKFFHEVLIVVEVRKQKDGSELLMNPRRVKKELELRKLIVPMYRPQTGKIQLLMPIYLKGTYSSKPDFALILTPDKENEYYTPETILPLDAVYQNARLIAKPDDTWLNPDTIL